MWWLRPIVLACTLALAGCGFRPLYGAPETGGAGRLAVEVTPIAEREGQVMRAALRRTFDAARAAEYRLDVTLGRRLETLAIDREGDVTRRAMTVTARWRLSRFDAPPETRPIEGTARVQEAFNVLASDYANIAAERAALERAAERLAFIVAEAATARARSQ